MHFDCNGTVALVEVCTVEWSFVGNLLKPQDFPKTLLVVVSQHTAGFSITLPNNTFLNGPQWLDEPKKNLSFWACWWYPPAQSSFAWIPRSLAPHETLYDTLCSECKSSVSGGLFMCDLMYPWCIVDVSLMDYLWFNASLTLCDTSVTNVRALSVVEYWCVTWCMTMCHWSIVELQPIPLGSTFSEAQSSKLQRLFFHVSVKRDVRALSFELWNSIWKCHWHPKWDWLYHQSRWLIIDNSIFRWFE